MTEVCKEEQKAENGRFCEKKWGFEERRVAYAYLCPEGATLAEIAEEAGMPLYLLAKENRLTQNPRAGDELIVRACGRPYRVEEGDTFASIARKFHTSEAEMERANAISAIYPGLLLYIP